MDNFYQWILIIAAAVVGFWLRGNFYRTPVVEVYKDENAICYYTDSNYEGSVSCIQKPLELKKQCKKFCEGDEW